MRYILLFLILIPFLFTACREDDGPSDCETFKNTKGEIQLWQPAGEKETILVQAENNDVIAGRIIFKLSKQYDEVRWLMNNDSNYTFTTKEVALSFRNPLRTYTALAIGTKFFSSKECGNIKLMDTLNTIFRTHMTDAAIGIFGKKFEIECTQYPGEKWTFYFQSINGPINDYYNPTGGGDGPARSYPDRTDIGLEPPYLIAVNFPRFENDSFRLEGFQTDNYTYFEGNVDYWDPFRIKDGIRTLGLAERIRLERDITTNIVTGNYSYRVTDSLTGRRIFKVATFKGIAK